MLTWSDLAEQFRSLETPHRSIWIDHQTGVCGDKWSVSSSGNMQARALFCELAAIAGAKLSELPAEVPSDQVLTEQQEMHRWFAVLEASTASIYNGITGQVTSPDGKPLGVVATHRMDDPVRDSVRACIRMAAIPKAEARLSTARRVWRVISAHPILASIVGTVVGGLILAWLL